MNVTVEAPAKINLTLDVVGRRDDGYHLVETVMQAVDLCDRVTVRRTDKPGAVSLLCGDARVPDGPDNTAVRAAAAFFAACGLPNPGVEIGLRKRIPLQAGLAGGSADAAGTLVALDRLMDTRMTAAELCAVAETVGADVPFCVLGAAAYAEGTGTILTPLPSLPDCGGLPSGRPCRAHPPPSHRRGGGRGLRRGSRGGGARALQCVRGSPGIARSGGDRAGDAGTRDARLPYDRKRVGGLRPFRQRRGGPPLHGRPPAGLRRGVPVPSLPSRAAIGSPGGRRAPAF